jgi:hypothetical protein
MPREARPAVPGAGASQSRAPGAGASRSHAPGAGASPSHAPGAGASPSHAPGAGASPSHAPGAGASPSHAPGAGASPSHAPGAGASPSRPPGRWRKLRGLSPADRRFVIGAGLGLPLVELGLRLLGPRRLIALLERALPAAGSPLGERDDEVAAARRAERLIGSAASGSPFRATCLRRAIALWWVLRRRGVACEVRLGVRRENGRVLAHSWVASGPVVLGEGDDQGRRFAAFEGAFGGVS